MLSDLTDAARAALAAASPSVVAVHGAHRLGAGFVLADDLIATNAHNIASNEITITFSDGARREGSTVGRDIDGDLAVVRVMTGGAPPLSLSPNSPAVGDVVFAVTRGSANEDRISFGLVTAMPTAFYGPRGRRITGSIEHSAPLPRGSSGSPIVDAAGRLVGINTHRPGDGFYQAIPATEHLLSDLHSLSAGETVDRATLGVGLASTAVAQALRHAVGLPPEDGALVRRVESGSRAEAAGIREGDLITSAAGTRILAPDDLLDALQGMVGQDVELTILRGVELVTVSVEFGTRG